MLHSFNEYETINLYNRNVRILKITIISQFIIYLINSIIMYLIVDNKLDNYNKSKMININTNKMDYNLDDKYLLLQSINYYSIKNIECLCNSAIVEQLVEEKKKDIAYSDVNNKYCYYYDYIEIYNFISMNNFINSKSFYMPYSNKIDNDSIKKKNIDTLNKDIKIKVLIKILYEYNYFKYSYVHSNSFKYYLSLFFPRNKTQLENVLKYKIKYIPDVNILDLLSYYNNNYLKLLVIDDHGADYILSLFKINNSNINYYYL